jgi:hypothetical protein
LAGVLTTASFVVAVAGVVGLLALDGVLGAS